MDYAKAQGTNRCNEIPIHRKEQRATLYLVMSETQ
jgi:hypothetical protein